ncbi:hypothetical protein LOTGIDRAFT_165219 [Lottia gigantea]|uniref:Uncharacterized protein n=1 Tax=Lottia gigantea TaxID=225164 RepID=V3ZCK3_LOTGI|nr:hypothetical protein LOTGIDRAFT_165219 [Lottia gigantea]ESO88803.1 hypothetical protein LOTGIDRAFT_165219 [Lottia gigantea]
MAGNIIDAPDCLTDSGRSSPMPNRKREMNGFEVVGDQKNIRLLQEADAILQTLQQSFVVEELTRSLFRLQDLFQNEYIQKYLENNQVYLPVLSVMKHLEDYIHIQLIGLQLLCQFIATSSTLQENIRHSDAHNLVIKILLENTSNTELILYGMKIFSSLLQSAKELCIQLKKERKCLEVLELIVKSITTFPDHEEIQINSLLSLAHYLHFDVEVNIEVLNKYFTCITESLALHSSHPQIVNQILLVFYRLAQHESVQQDMVQSRFLVEVMYPILVSRPNDINLQIHGLRIFANTACGLFKEKESTELASEWTKVIYSSMSQQMDNAYIQELCCKALSELLCCKPEAYMWIGDSAELRQDPLHTLCLGALLMHRKIQSVFTSACECFFYLTADNDWLCKNMMEKNSHVAIIEGIKQHIDTAKAVAAGCKAIRGLCIFHDENKLIVSEYDDILMLLVKILRMYNQDIGVLCEAISTIACLADNDVIRHQCLVENVHGYLLVILDEFTEDVIIQEAVIETLAVIGGATSGAEILNRDGTVEKIIRTLLNFQLYINIQKKGIMTLQIIVDNDILQSEDMCSDLTQLIKMIMMTHKNVLSVQREAVVFMQILAEKGKRMSKILVNQGCHELLFQILEKYVDDKGLNELAIGCLYITGLYYLAIECLYITGLYELASECLYITGLYELASECLYFTRLNELARLYELAIECFYITGLYELASKCLYFTGLHDLASECSYNKGLHDLASECLYVTGSHELAFNGLYITGSHELARLHELASDCLYFTGLHDLASECLYITGLYELASDCLYVAGLYDLAIECLYITGLNELARLHDLASECLYVIGCEQNLKSDMLLVACAKGFYLGVECLLQIGSDVNIGEGQETPLYYAVKNQDENMVKLILEHNVCDILTSLQLSLDKQYDYITGLLLSYIDSDRDHHKAGVVVWNGIGLGDLKPEWFLPLIGGVREGKTAPGVGRRLSTKIKKSEQKRAKRLTRSPSDSYVDIMKHHCWRIPPNNVDMIKHRVSIIKQIREAETLKARDKKTKSLPKKIKAHLSNIKDNGSKKSPQGSPKVSSTSDLNLRYNSTSTLQGELPLTEEIDASLIIPIPDDPFFENSTDEWEEWKKTTLTGAKFPFHPDDPRRQREKKVGGMTAPPVKWQRKFSAKKSGYSPPPGQSNNFQSWERLSPVSTSSRLSISVEMGVDRNYRSSYSIDETDLETSFDESSDKQNTDYPEFTIKSLDVSSNNINTLDLLVAKGEIFLQKFEQVTKLDICHNRISALPSTLTQVVTFYTNTAVCNL